MRFTSFAFLTVVIIQLSRIVTIIYLLMQVNFEMVFLLFCFVLSSGNLLQLNEALQRHEAFFIRCGIYLILEKLKVITYRNLFKKV